jgi:hypothetical protein
MPEFEPVGPHIDHNLPADLIDSGADRRWPRPGVTAVAAIVIVVGATLAGDGSAVRFQMPVGAESDRWQVGPDSPVLAPVSDPPDVGFPPSSLELPGDVVHFDIGTSGYAAVAAEDCDGGDICKVSLATSDGLGRWWRGTLPRDTTRSGHSPRPLVLDNGVLVLDDYGEQTPGGWYSRDGGRTWLPVPTLRRLALRHARGGRLHLQRVGLPTNEPCGGRKIAGYLRRSGQLVPLREQPRLRPCSVAPFPDLAGRRWTAGITLDGAAVAVSVDDGRSWSESPLPGTEHAEHVETALTGRYAYAVVFGRVAELPGTTVTGVFRYGAGGWSLIWRPGGVATQQVRQVTVCPEGLLLSPLPGGGRARAHEVAGLPAVAATAVPGHGWYGWYLEARSARPVYSRDCRGWRGLTVS